MWLTCDVIFFAKTFTVFVWGGDVFCFIVEVPINCLMGCQYLLLFMVPRELVAMTSNTLSTVLAPPASQIIHYSLYSITAEITSSCTTRTYFTWDIVLCHWLVSTCCLHCLGLGMRSEVGTWKPIRCRCSPFLCHPGKKYCPLRWVQRAASMACRLLLAIYILRKITKENDTCWHWFDQHR